MVTVVERAWIAVTLVDGGAYAGKCVDADHCAMVVTLQGDAWIGHELERRRTWFWFSEWYEVRVNIGGDWYRSIRDFKPLPREAAYLIEQVMLRGEIDERTTEDQDR